MQHVHNTNMTHYGISGPHLISVINFLLYRKITALFYSSFLYKVASIMWTVHAGGGGSADSRQVIAHILQNKYIYFLQLS